MKKNKLQYQCLFMFYLFLLTFGFSAEPENKVSVTRDIQAWDTGHFNGNRIYTDMENNGMVVSHRIAGHSGMEWPYGMYTFVNFASGIWVSGLVNGEIRIAASEYGSEYAPGPYGGDPNDETYKLYKVNLYDLKNPSANPDFQNWPVDDGAPWVDVDNDGIYTPLPNGQDHPKFLGDQVIWYVANDGDILTHTIFGTEPLGLETQTTIWGYDRLDPLGDMMFVKQLIINKNVNTIENAYIGLWADPDLGDAGDDFVGCDTILGMGFCYNDGEDKDFGINVPALGYDFLQGPIIPSMGDTAYAFGRTISDYKTLKMTSFSKYINTTDPDWSDPDDAIEVYNLMRGLKKDGMNAINTETGEITKFFYPDDPSLNTGYGDGFWADADDHPAGDRRFLMNAGPFTMAPGDSQEVIFAIIIGLGTSALESVTRLKEVDQYAQAIADNHYEQPYDTTYYDFSQVGNFHIIYDNLNNDGQVNNGELIQWGFDVANIYIDSASFMVLPRIMSSGIIGHDIQGIVIENMPNMPWPNSTYSLSEDEAPLIYISPGFNQPEIAMRIDILDIASGMWNYHDVTIPVTILDYEPSDSTQWADHTRGDSEGRIGYWVVNPNELKGHTYTVSFTSSYYADYPFEITRTSETGDFPPTRTQNKLLDCSGSSISGQAIILPSEDQVRLLFNLDMKCENNWIEGILLDFPDNIEIVRWDTVGNCNYANSGQNCVNRNGTFDPTVNTITWGDSSRSQFGMIENGTQFSVYIKPPLQYPFSYYWTIWDDGFDNTIVDAAGTDTIYEAYYEMIEGLGFSLYDETIGEWLFTKHALPDEHLFRFPVIDGFKLVIEDAPEDLKSISVVSNANGEIYPPVEGVASWSFPDYLVADGNYTDQQVTTDAIWFYNIGPQYGFDQEAMLSAMFRYTGGYGIPGGSGLRNIIPDVFEIRFTGNGKAINYWADKSVIDVPFEWWNIGNVDDPSDDYKLISYVLDEDGNNEWNLQFGREEADHRTSGGLNDPWTDRVHVLSPVNDSPGTEGYDNFMVAAESGSSNLPQWYNGPGDNDPGGPLDAWHVLRGQVFMLWDGGEVTTATSPADYTAEAPEIGTVFRIVTNPVLDTLDIYQFTTANMANNDNIEMPNEYRLLQNYPNPFNPITTIKYKISKNVHVKLIIYDLLGRELRILVNKVESPGQKHIVWDGKDQSGRLVSSGMYFYRLEAGNYKKTRKMVLLK